MRPETKQLFKNISIGLGVFLLVGLILYGIYEGTRATALTIDTVQVSGGETVSHDRVRAEVEQLLEGDYAGFVPRRFAWTYPETEIVEAVQATPRVKDPVINRDGKVITIAFAEYEPVALWCGALEVHECVFLDEVGYGFAAAPTLDGGAFTRYVQVGQPATTGAVFTDTTDFAQLRELVSLLDEFGWPVSVVELDQARDVFVQLVGESELKVSLTLTAAETMDNLQTVLTADKYTDFAPGAFAYIDLRFGNKVFVSEFGDPADQPVESEEQIKTATSSEATEE